MNARLLLKAPDMTAHRGVLTVVGTILVSVGLLLIPTYAGPPQRATLPQINGYHSVILAVPVAISILGALSNRLRVLAGLLMLLWVAAGVFTVGLFYLPLVACLLWPARRDRNGMGPLTLR